MADEELGKLVIKLRLDLAEMQKSSKEAQESTRNLAEDIKGSWTELNAKKEVLTDVFDKVKGVIDETVGKTVEYAAQVRQMMREVGMSAEDASKLIQAADDVNVSFETLQTGMRMAIKNGISPTMEGMEELADKYVAIQDPVERTRFLFDNFGKAGAELGPLMELGADGIREAGDAAEQTGLVMSEQGVKSAREYEIALDNLGDSWDALMIAFGKSALPQLAGNLKIFAQNISDLQSGNKNLWQVLVDNQKEYDILDKTIRDTTDTSYDWSDAEREAARAAVDVSAATQDSAQAAKDNAEAQAGAKQKLDLVTASMKNVTAEMIYQRAAAGLDADAALELARGMGLINEKSYYVLDSLDKLKVKYDTNADGLIDATEAAAGYNAEVKTLADRYGLITDKTVTLNVKVNRTEFDNFVNNGYADLPGVKLSYAKGADFIVPSGYPNDSFGPIYVESGEHVQVTPAGETNMTSAAMLQSLNNIERALNNIPAGNITIPINAGGASPVDYVFLAEQVVNVIQRRRR